MIMNCGLGYMGEEVAVACFKAQRRHSSGSTRRNHRGLSQYSCCLEWESKWIPPITCPTRYRRIILTVVGCVNFHSYSCSERD